MLDELEILFESKTIEPTFKLVHAVLALYIFGENEEGLGRYRLQKELDIGSGTARSLITKMKEKADYLAVLKASNRKGHILTRKGNDFLEALKSKIPLLIQADYNKLKDIVLDSKEIYTYFCIVKNSASKISDGIKQRDAAILLGGIGTTCLLFDGNDYIFPSKSIAADDKEFMRVPVSVKDYFNSIFEENNLQIEREDAILIGLGATPEIARLSALNAALTLLNK
ncbi:MAG: DUF4443 domain-containing protein [Promethearchaeota archaeon]